MIEIDQLEKHPEKTLGFLSQVSRDAESRIASRIILEEVNLDLKKLPLGGEEGLDSILSFIPTAKEGYALSLRSSELEKDQIQDVLRITTPQSLVDFASELGIGLTSVVVNQEPRLSVYRHALATLLVLSKLSRVDSEQVGETVVGSSTWPYQMDKERLWYVLSEIEDSTRKIIMDRRQLVGRDAKMRALHFFAVGRILAEELK